MFKVRKLALFLVVALLAGCASFGLGNVVTREEAFSGFDAAVKHGDNGYEEWPRWKKFLVDGFLDANHHFQYGLVVMLIAMLRPVIWVFDFSWLNVHPTITLILLWLGFGLVSSDWKDYQNVLKRMNINN